MFQRARRWGAATGIEVAANEAAIAAYGYTREEFLTMTINEIRPDEDRGDPHELTQDSPNFVVGWTPCPRRGT